MDRLSCVPPLRWPQMQNKTILHYDNENITVTIVKAMQIKKKFMFFRLFVCLFADGMACYMRTKNKKKREERTNDNLVLHFVVAPEMHTTEE